MTGCRMNSQEITMETAAAIDPSRRYRAHSIKSRTATCLRIGKCDHRAVRCHNSVRRGRPGQRIQRRRSPKPVRDPACQRDTDRHGLPTPRHLSDHRRRHPGLERRKFHFQAVIMGPLQIGERASQQIDAFYRVGHQVVKLLPAIVEPKQFELRVA